MFKSKSFFTAILVSATIISFKLSLFYGNQIQTSSLGKWSDLLSLGLIIASIPFSVYWKKRSVQNLLNEGKEIVKTGAVTMLWSALFLSIFNFIFFKLELKEYMMEYLNQADLQKKFLEEKMRNPKITLEIIKKAHQTELNHLQEMSAFSYVNFKLMPHIFLGLISSFIFGALLRK